MKFLPLTLCTSFCLMIFCQTVSAQSVNKMDSQTADFSEEIKTNLKAIAAHTYSSLLKCAERGKLNDSDFKITFSGGENIEGIEISSVWIQVTQPSPNIQNVQNCFDIRKNKINKELKEYFNKRSVFMAFAKKERSIELTGNIRNKNKFVFFIGTERKKLELLIDKKYEDPIHQKKDSGTIAKLLLRSPRLRDLLAIRSTINKANLEGETPADQPPYGGVSPTSNCI